MKRTRLRDRCFSCLGSQEIDAPRIQRSANAADVAQSCPNKSAAGVICKQTSGPQNSITATAVRYGGGVGVAGMQLLGDAFADVHSIFIVAQRYSLKIRYLLSTRVVNGQTEHARMDLVFNAQRFGSRIWMCPLFALFSCKSVPGLSSQHKTRTYGQESGKRTQFRHISTHQPRSFSSSDTTGRPWSTYARKIHRLTSCEMPITPPLAIRGHLVQPSQVCSTSAISKQQLTAAVT